MSPRVWLNLGLAALLIGLALLAWLRPGERPAEEHRLITLEPDTIDRIRIARAEQPTIAFERRENQWTLVSPIEMPANEVRIGELLNLAMETSDNVYRARDMDLTKYGLADPTVTVTLNDQIIDFGDINPVNYLRYVQVSNSVYLISDVMAGLETAEPASYVTPKLLPAGAELQALRLPKLALRRGKDGEWKSTAGKLAQSDIDALLDAWQAAQAYRIGTYEKDQDAGSSAKAVVILANGEQLKFNVTESEAELILSRPESGIQYHLPADAAMSLLKSAPDVAEAEAPGTGDADTTRPAD